MNTWYRISPMMVNTESNHDETWISTDSDDSESREYKVNVRLGKPLDVTSLKKIILQNFVKEVDYYKSTREALFRSQDLVEIEMCPVCKSSVTESQLRLDVYGGRYHQCSVCSHCYLVARPSESALNTFYADDDHYSSTYVDKKSLETRVQQVAVPKAEWVIEQFRLLYNRKPSSILDIGAGGGHFVYASRQMGINAVGIETSNQSRRFCKDNFGFELEAIDFVQDWKKFSDIDVITFWGLIEHVPEPLDLLRAAYRALSGRDTLVVASSPHWDSFGTAVQTLFPNSVIRHLDPLGHLHIFTESSLATAFESCRFAPVAAWYFGMDAYELINQLSISTGVEIDDSDRELLSQLQDVIDRGRLSDSVVLAGRPSPRTVN